MRRASGDRLKRAVWKLCGKLSLVWLLAHDNPGAGIQVRVAGAH